MTDFSDKFARGASVALRLALGWHLAYLGVWALTSLWTHSWVGAFRCAHWLFGGCFNAVANSALMNGVDFVLAWGLLLAGILLLVGRGVRAAALFGMAYVTLAYLLDPPHFGHTGPSHFLYVDRNAIELLMFLYVFAERMFASKEVAQ